MTRALAALSRITPVALLVRGLTFALTTAALLLATPSFLFDLRLVGIALVAALIVAIVPGSRMVTLVLMGCVVGWVAGWMGRPVDLTALELVVFSSVLFLAHSSAALAAVIPVDAVVSPGVLARWYMRALGIVAASAGVALVLLAGAALSSGLDATAIASLAGLAAAVSLVLALVRLTRRKDRH
jgi:hypothetical protein